MSREKNLVKNTAILSLGTFLPKVATMITLPLLTGHLSTTEFGTYDLIITLVALLLPAVTLQVQSAAFRFLIETRNNREESKKVISNIILFTVAVSLVAVVILYFVLYTLDTIIRLEIAIYFLFDIILITMRQIARGIGDNVAFSVNAITNSVVMMVSTAVALVVFEAGLFGVLIALILSTVWSVVFLSIRLKIYEYISLSAISISVLKKMLSYSWPMVPNNLSNWVLSLSNRIIITVFLGLEANAVYAVANKIPNLFKTFQSTFMYAWQENATITKDDDDSVEYYSVIFDGTFSLLSAAMALLIASSPILFHFLIRGSYSAAYYQMSVLYMGVFFSSISGFMGSIYIAHMKSKSVGVTTVLAATVNLLVDLLLIRRVGLYAGSIATLVSYFCLAVFRMVDSYKFQPIKYKFSKIIFSIAILVLMCVLSFYRTLTFNILNILIALALSYVLNKQLLYAMLGKLTKKIKQLI